jgi:hypothetical protein
MPSPEWAKQTSFNSVQKFFMNHSWHASSALKLVKTWRSETINGGPLSGNDTMRGKDNNDNFPKKGSNSGNSSGDDSSDRSEYAPRVVAVAMKDNKIKLPCQPQARNLSPGKHGKDHKVSSQSDLPQRTVKNNDSNGIKPETPLRPVSLEQILRNGSSRNEQDIIENFPALSESDTLTHAGERNQVDKPLFLPHISTPSGSGNDSRNNLSTVIAVSSAGNQEEIHTGTNSKLSIRKPVAEDKPLSSTFIVANCANSHEDGSLNSPFLPLKMKDCSNKNLVCRDIKEKYMQNQPSAGIRVTVSISSQLEKCNDIPPPIPPLPVALRSKICNKEEKIINDKEPQSKVGLVPSSVSGKVPLPLNRLCIHPKIKLKNLQSSPPTISNHKPSRIPKLRPTLTGLHSVDCLVSLYEDGIAAEQRRKEIQKEEEQKKKVNRSLKQSWDELFKKYEALERECDSMSSVTNNSDCNLSSKSVSNLFSIKKAGEGSKYTSNHYNSFETSKQNNHEVFKKFEIGRLKSAPCSLLHLKDAVESDNGEVLSSVVSETTSEGNLCSKSVKEQEWPNVVTYNKKTFYLKSSKSEKEINNNQVVLRQSGNESETVRCDGTSAVVGLANVETGGIGVVCASTGRQVSSCRYRTELEV